MGVVVTFVLTALEPRDFRDEVRENVRWGKAGDDPNKVMQIMHEVNGKCLQCEAVESGTSGDGQGLPPPGKQPTGEERRWPSEVICIDYRVQQPPRTPADGCWHCGGAQRMTRYPQLAG